MIERQPRDGPVVRAHFQAVVVDGEEIGHQRSMGHRHAQREPGAARGELQVGEPVRVRARQVPRGWLEGEVGVAAGNLEVQPFGGLAHPVAERLGTQGGAGVGGDQHAAHVFDIAVPAAERRGQRHRRGHQACILAGEEAADEVRIALRHQADPIAGQQARGQQPPAQYERLFTQPTPGQGLGQFSAWGIDVHARLARGGVVERLGDGGEVRAPERAVGSGGRRRHA